MGFETDIKPLFRDRDRHAMQAWFDLASYAEVYEHAADILERLEEGDMPCDTPWTRQQVDTFRDWLAEDCPR